MSAHGLSFDTQGTDRLFDVVLGDHRPKARRPRWQIHVIAWIVAVLAHLMLWAAANETEPSLETWSAQLGAQIHNDLVATGPVAIENTLPPDVKPTPKVEAPPQPEPVTPEPVMDKAEPKTADKAEPLEPKAKRPQRARPSKAKPVDKPAPPTDAEPAGEARPPGEAGKIIAADPDPAGPVDLTDNTFITGGAQTYAGGASASDGTSKTAVSSRDVARDAPPDSGSPPKTGPSQARRVQLSGSEWRCEWPASAIADDIYEQFVVLRVAIRADGTLAKTTVVDDPGHGFGAAAVACARRTKFSPALGADGKPITATSPPIRVRFTR